MKLTSLLLFLYDGLDDFNMRSNFRQPEWSVEIYMCKLMPLDTKFDTFQFVLFSTNYIENKFKISDGQGSDGTDCFIVSIDQYMKNKEA